MRKLTVIISLVVLALVLAGCGGSNVQRQPQQPYNQETGIPEYEFRNWEREQFELEREQEQREWEWEQEQQEWEEEQMRLEG